MHVSGEVNEEAVDVVEVLLGHGFEAPPVGPELPASY
jgi:hypothetical protein